MPSPNDPKTITPSRTHARTHRRLLQCGFLVVIFFLLLIYALDFARAYVDSLPVSRNALILMDVFARSRSWDSRVYACLFVWFVLFDSIFQRRRSPISDQQMFFCALHFAAVAAAAAASGCLFCGCPNASVNSFDTSRPAFVPAALTTLLLLPPTDRTSVQLALFLFPLVSRSYKKTMITRAPGEMCEMEPGWPRVRCFKVVRTSHRFNRSSARSERTLFAQPDRT